MTKLKLEKYMPTDFQVYFDLAKDDEIMKYIFGRGMTEKEAKKKFDFFIELNQQNEKLGYFKVYEDLIHIGDAKLANYREDESVFEVGYLVAKTFWGKGYGSKICEIMLERANEINPKKDIIGIIATENVGSKKVLQKFGFETYFLGIEDGWNTEKLKLRKS